MQRLVPLFLTLFALMPARAIEAPPGPVAFVNGMLLDGYEAEPIQQAVVVIEGNRIVAAGPRHRTPIPAGATVVDIGGKTILPGLIDAHVHVDLIGHGDYDRYYTFLGGMERLDEVMPIAAKQMLRAGVTSAIDLGTPLEILELREKIRANEIPGPRLTVSGPWITRVYLEGVPDEYQLVATNPREAAAHARTLVRAGVDVIKTWVGLTLEDYEAIVEVAHEAGLKVHAHLYDPDAIRLAIDAGVDVLQHVGSARNPPYADALISEIAHKGIPVVQTIAHRIWVYPATVAFPERLNKPVYAKDMPEDIYAEFMASFEDFHRLSYFHDIGLETRNSKRSARQFIDGGAYMGVGTDAASPLNMHDEAIRFEMEALVESGMTPIQVISAATRINAEILGRFDELGSVEPGKLADLVIVRGNPLADISNVGNVDIVVKDGLIFYAETAANGPVTTIGNAF
ncbi:MAG: amidohydrolase family protein [Woeseiaceae bacterium]|jgi:imidazolonepropionase-like amidohydrolase|nr:amidohydrolase family protein [Woeseiaceae bacterium]